MAKFVLIFTGGEWAENEEDQAKVMEAWGAWFEGLGEALVDPGNAFSPNVRNVVSDGTVSEGAVGDPATGYTILQADSLESAVSLAKGCPLHMGNASISIYEAVDM